MGWWLEAFGRGGGDADSVRRLLDPAGGPFILPTFGASERRAIFGATLKQVGSELQPPETPEFARRLAELSWGGEPLFLMMAGLTAARAGLGHVLALSPTAIVFEVAGHELHRIREIGRHRSVDGGFLAHMAAFVTLCQGLSRSQAEEAIEVEKRRLRYDSVGDPPRIYQALHDALPGDGSDVSPLLPDILGEAVTLVALGAGDSTKAEDAVMRAVASGEEKVLPVLIRTADDFGSDRKEVLNWLRRWVRDGERDNERLMHFADQLPQQTLALREFAADLEAQLVERSRQGDQKGWLAECLNNLSVRLSALGRREEALDTCQEAVSLYRELASASPNVLPHLAGFLSNLAARLSDLGRHEEALDAGQEAVFLYRDLASEHPDAFRAYLAMSLNNLANRLRAVERHEEALNAGQEAVSLFRSLASAFPDVFRADLAESLNNLTVRLGNVGLRKDALVVSQEAVSLFRDLASVRPNAFRPNLARSLNNLAVQLGELGRHEEALDASQEAVSLNRELASVLDVFRSNLANSLINLAGGLGALGHREEALNASQEAVSLHRDLAFALPDAFRPNLATSLDNLAVRLSALERHEEALEAGQEAVSLYRFLASAHPETFRSNLAFSLSNLTNRLKAVGFREEALKVGQEAVSLYRELALSHSEAFRLDLARALYNLSLLAPSEQAIEACYEAIELFVPIFLAIPALGKRMADMVLQYFLLAQEMGRQPDPYLLTPLVEAGFFETETEDSTSPGEIVYNPEEEPQ